MVVNPVRATANKNDESDFFMILGICVDLSFGWGTVDVFIFILFLNFASRQSEERHSKKMAISKEARARFPGERKESTRP